MHQTKKNWKPSQKYIIVLPKSNLTDIIEMASKTLKKCINDNVQFNFHYRNNSSNQNICYFISWYL
jgi:hypothetical protein